MTGGCFWRWNLESPRPTWRPIRGRSPTRRGARASWKLTCWGILSWSCWGRRFTGHELAAKEREREWRFSSHAHACERLTKFLTGKHEIHETDKGRNNLRLVKAFLPFSDNFFPSYPPKKNPPPSSCIS